MEINILDCTLRDGGYVNNWEFDTDTAADIMECLYQSGIRCIEIGIMGKGGKRGKSTKFSSFQEIELLLSNKKEDCRYAVMMTWPEAGTFEIPERNQYTVDMIRLAFFKEGCRDALRYAKKMIQKGYEVFLQPMATFMYSRDELNQMIEQVNAVRPKALYMVDSFSNLYPKDVRIMADCILKELDRNIDFGFHAHNNIQMAFANVIEFLDTDTQRDLYVDGSIFGMGRGAGNVPVELLMEFLNKEGARYDISRVLYTYQKYIKPIFEQNYWGYDHAYYLTASRSMNSVYSWYFVNHGIQDILLLEKALEGIREENKHTLVRNNADEVLKLLKNGRNTCR